jgi:hydroxymethylpyrimidine kinase/phosphomethylpyrimidine kinase
MLANAEVVGVVAEAVREYRLERLVVDPVLVAQSGDRLLEEDAVAVLREQLLPCAAVLTPNTLEAAELLGAPVDSVADMREAARRLRALGARAVLVKGGHLTRGAESVDVLDDGEGQHELRAPRLHTPHTHGTGCMLSAAIAVGLAEGMPPIDAARRAKRFITEAIRDGLAIGSGNGPANPLAWNE